MGSWEIVGWGIVAEFVHEQGALASVLRVAAMRDEEMLASLQDKPG